MVGTDDCDAQKKAELDKQVASRRAARDDRDSSRARSRFDETTDVAENNGPMDLDDIYVLDSAGDNDEENNSSSSAPAFDSQQSLSAKQEQQLANDYQQFVTSVNTGHHLVGADALLLNSIHSR